MPTILLAPKPLKPPREAAQGSTWLIDPYWTIAPPMIAMYYLVHPLSVGASLRVVVSAGLLLVWALRLTHSYLRRECWEIGLREDWRYADMARSHAGWWPLTQVRTAQAKKFCFPQSITCSRSQSQLETMKHYNRCELNKTRPVYRSHLPTSIFGQYPKGHL